MSLSRHSFHRSTHHSNPLIYYHLKQNELPALSSRVAIMSQKHRSKSAVADCPSSGIRGEYEAHGAEEFYQSQGSLYSNPHEEQLKIGFPRCLEIWKDKLPIPQVSLLLWHLPQGLTCAQGSLLDLACGSGEITCIINSLFPSVETHGIDPFTFEA